DGGEEVVVVLMMVDLVAVAAARWVKPRWDGVGWGGDVMDMMLVGDEGDVDGWMVVDLVAGGHAGKMNAHIKRQTKRKLERSTKKLQRILTRLNGVAAAAEMTRTVVGRRGVRGGFGVMMMEVLLICGCDSRGGGDVDGWMVVDLVAGGLAGKMWAMPEMVY
nr:hypothetical protein [Tanacetum cinerariifolium]